MSLNDLVLKEVKDLPSEKIREVLDFILFIKQKDDQQFLLEAAETSLKTIWDTPEEDAAWKDL
jgi:hypothetical protein